MDLVIMTFKVTITVAVIFFSLRAGLSLYNWARWVSSENEHNRRVREARNKVVKKS